MKLKSTSKNTPDPGRSCRTVLGVMAALLACSLAQAAPGDLRPPDEQPTHRDGNTRPASTFQYLYIPATAFHVRGVNGQPYGDINQCLYVSGTPIASFAHKALLPQGARIQYLRLYAYDNSASYVRAWLTAYNSRANYNDLTHVDSGDGDYNSQLSPQIDYVVDNIYASTNVVIQFSDQDGSALRFCGVRIAYYFDPGDVIFTNGFE